jgi:hypothetical protein
LQQMFEPGPLISLEMPCVRGNVQAKAQHHYGARKEHTFCPAENTPQRLLGNHESHFAPTFLIGCDSPAAM